MIDSIQARLLPIIKEFPFENFGFVRLSTPQTIQHYKSWINDQYHGDMNYLKDHIPQKENHEKLSPQARSAIVITRSYLPHPKVNTEDFPLKNLKIARYAQGDDYHHWFKDELQQLCKKLKQEFPKNEFEAFSDSGPILERDLAHKAGLGWFGKNSCLIHSQYGSFFLIGEVFTDLQLKPHTITHPDRCGTCTRCIDACPTNALLNNKTMDATKCISYHNIESKQTPPETMIPQFQNWFFGCDICQQVCPWNQKNHTATNLKDPDVNLVELKKELSWILTSSNKKLQKVFRKSPLSRARGFGLKRNALIQIYQYDLKELTPLIKEYEDHEKLKTIAQWILNQWHFSL